MQDQRGGIVEKRHNAGRRTSAPLTAREAARLHEEVRAGATRYLGTAQRGAAAVPKLHFPGLSEQAARWLVTERRVRAVGIDTASIDRGQSTAFEAHRVLAAAQVPVFENVTALDKVPVEGFQVVALPMKIDGGSGGPLRTIAVVAR